jgi:hypothetical protein
MPTPEGEITTSEINKPVVVEEEAVDDLRDVQESSVAEQQGQD